MNNLSPSRFYFFQLIFHTCLLASSLSAVEKNVINSLPKAPLHQQETSQVLEKVCIEKPVRALPKLPLDDNKKEALFKAIKNNNMKEVQWFLDTYEGVVKARGQYEVTPFHCAALNGYVEIAKRLKEYGAKFETTNKYRDNALHLSCYFSDNTEMVRWILDTCDTSLIEAKGYKKRTPLLSAAFRGKLKVLKLLIEKKADVNIQDENGYTALHHAAMNNDVEVAKRLIEGRANIYAKTSWLFGKTPLDIAKEYKKQAMISYLETQTKTEGYFSFWFSWF